MPSNKEGGGAPPWNPLYPPPLLKQGLGGDDHFLYGTWGEGGITAPVWQMRGGGGAAPYHTRTAEQGWVGTKCLQAVQANIN